MHLKVVSARHAPLTVHIIWRKTLRALIMEEYVTSLINLGTPVEFTIRQLVELVLATTHSRFQIIFRLPATGQPTAVLTGDLARSDSTFWQPAMIPEQSSARTIAYFDAPLGARGMPSRGRHVVLE